VRLRRNLLSLSLMLLWAASVHSTVPASGETPSSAQVTAAVSALNADPSLAEEQKLKTLRWAGHSHRAALRPPGWLDWIGQLFMWIAESARALLWVAGLLLVAFLVLYLLRRIREARLGPDAGATQAPSHVRDLDIRPESLPDDIGAEALTRWEAGEHRAALSLLYRGLLSRLVHAFSLPIRQSSTEGECVQLTERLLGGPPAIYAARLVRIWQRSVYGGLEPDSRDVRTLCEQFQPSLAARPAGHAAAQPA